MNFLGIFMILQDIDSLILEAARWKKQAGLTHQGTKSFGKKVGKNTALYGQKRLSKDSLERIRQAGIIKPESEYDAGINYGTKQIALKSGVKKIQSDEEHPHWNPETKTIHTSGQTLATRHEALEAREGNPKSKPPLHFLVKKGRIIGYHNSPKVIQDEKRLGDQYKTLYNKPFSHNLQRQRKNTGQYRDFIQNLSSRKIKLDDEAKDRTFLKNATPSKQSYYQKFKNETKRPAYTMGGKINFHPVINLDKHRVDSMTHDDVIDQLDNLMKQRYYK
jgi:hypothetical protein